MKRLRHESAVNVTTLPSGGNIALRGRNYFTIIVFILQ